jgi:ATP-binding protein involved in chromosome partitioning
VVADPTAPAAAELTRVAQGLSGRGRNLAGMQLGLTPAGKL